MTVNNDINDDSATKHGDSHTPSKTISAESAKEQRKKEKEKALHAAKRFVESLDSRLRDIEGEKCSLAHSSRGADSRGGRVTGSKSSPKPKSGKRQDPSNGSAKSDISSWFDERAFSDQSGQSGSTATSHHRETRQASDHREQAVDRQTKGHVGGSCSKFTPRRTSFFRVSKRAFGSKPRKL